MNKKLVIIAGQTGVGKTKVANDLARKINGEIILVDSIQLYKHMNIIANKPSRFLQESAKYHNMNEYDFKDGTVSAISHAEKIRKTINEVWSRNKVPILEGGCGFYYKTILTGASSKMTEEQETMYSKYISVAREIIKRDGNFQTSFDRLRRMDSSLPELLTIKNDFYRLEKRIADAIMYGDGAHKIIQDLEGKIRDQNKFPDDTEIYKFFLFCDKIILNQKIQDRTEKMLESGILKEVSDLLSNNIITPEMFSKDNTISSSVFIHAYGLVETVQYLINILDQIDNKQNIINSYGSHISKKDSVGNKFKTIAFKLLFDLLNGISISSRQYAKRQATWFKRNDNFLWLNAEENSIADNIIQNYLPMSKDNFDSLMNSEENDKVKLKYNWSNIKKTDSSYFKVLKNNISIKNFVVDSFKFSEKNKDKLLEIKNILKSNNGNSVESTLEDDKVEKIDQSLVDKYFKM
jgi:tRNA dimethylallyltransferase